MRLPLFIGLVFSVLSLSAQRDTTLLVADYNEDGYPDSLRSWYSGGSGAGGRFVEMTDGQSGEQLSFNSCGSFGNFVQIIPIAEDIYDRYYAFLAPILQALAGGRARVGTDPSLSWLGQMATNLLQDTARGPKPPGDVWIPRAEDLRYALTCGSTNDHPYFDRFLGGYELWETDSLIRPGISTSIDIHPRLGALMYQFALDTSQLAADAYSFFLIYYGHNHFSRENPDFTELAANENYRILSSAHGLIAQRPNGDYKWLFISQPGITRAPMKLRWPSISSVQLAGDYALLEQQFSVSQEAHLWVIDIPSGRLGKIREDLYGLRYDEASMELVAPDYRLEGMHLIILEGEEEKTIPLQALFESD
ncbi:MAG: hypothetical protein AAF433_12365 [Bacteroidota bacterium]